MVGASVPFFASGVGKPVKNGISYGEAHILNGDIHRLQETAQIGSTRCSYVTLELESGSEIETQPVLWQ